MPHALSLSSVVITLLISSLLTSIPVRVSMIDFSDTFEFYVEGVLLFIVAVIGIIGNISFIIIFSTHQKKLNTFHSLMVCLAYFDTIYLASSLFIFSLPLLTPRIAQTYIFTHAITVLLPTAHMGINGKCGNAGSDSALDKKYLEEIVKSGFLVKSYRTKFTKHISRIHSIDNQFGCGEVCNCLSSILQSQTQVRKYFDSQ